MEGLNITTGRGSAGLSSGRGGEIEAMHETWWRRQEAQPLIPERELRFMMKLGRVERDEAVRLLGRYRGDREAVYAELRRRDMIRARNARPH
jgi:hypothetical protein